MPRKRVIMSWSSGKDSAWAVHTLRSDPDIELRGLLTTVTAEFDRVSMHGVRTELLRAQADALQLPLHVVEIPSPCPNEVYAARMEVAVRRAVESGATHVAFGDLFLRDVRDYRERMLAGSGLEPLFPLWGRPTDALAQTMLDAGLQATLTCVDPKQMDPAWCGRPFDRDLLAALPPGADPCAERGEFHTFAHAGPMFRHPIAIEVGPTVERDGFVFADLRPA